MKVLSVKILNGDVDLQYRLLHPYRCRCALQAAPSLQMGTACTSTQKCGSSQNGNFEEISDNMIISSILCCRSLVLSRSPWRQHDWTPEYALTSKFLTCSRRKRVRGCCTSDASERDRGKPSCLEAETCGNRFAVLNLVVNC